MTYLFSSRPEWLKDEYKYAIFQIATDDVEDTLITFEKTIEDAERRVANETEAYGDVPEYQFYYEHV